MLPMINNLIVWTKKTEFEEEMRKSHRSMELVNNLAPVQIIRKYCLPTQSNRPKPEPKQRASYIPELERCELVGHA